MTRPKYKSIIHLTAVKLIVTFEWMNDRTHHCLIASVWLVSWAEVITIATTWSNRMTYSHIYTSTRITALNLFNLGRFSFQYALLYKLLPWMPLAEPLDSSEPQLKNTEIRCNTRINEMSISIWLSIFRKTSDRYHWFYQYKLSWPVFYEIISKSLIFVDNPLAHGSYCIRLMLLGVTASEKYFV